MLSGQVRLVLGSSDLLLALYGRVAFDTLNIVGEASLAMTMSDRLFAEGVFAQGIGFPTVAKDKARLADLGVARITYGPLLQTAATDAMKDMLRPWAP